MALIRVAADTSLEESLVQLTSAFEAETGHTLSYHFGSSGNLACQINAYTIDPDIFISANQISMDAVNSGILYRGLMPNSRQNFLRNRLVLIKNKHHPLPVPISGFAEVTAAAIANVSVSHWSGSAGYRRRTE